jgi:hypothetical protein
MVERCLFYILHHLILKIWLDNKCSIYWTLRYNIKIDAYEASLIQYTKLMTQK